MFGLFEGDVDFVDEETENVMGLMDLSGKELVIFDFAD